MSSSPSISGPSSRDSRVTAAIAQAAARTGVDFSYLYNQAKVESGLNPAARARTSSATGLYQFTHQTWLATLKKHGSEHGLGWAADAIAQGSDGRYSVSDSDLRNTILDLREQPDPASAMAAEFAADNTHFLQQRLERPVEAVDMYLAHFLGAGGASRFLSAHASDPSTPAAAIVPTAAAANRSIFYRSDGRARSLDEVRSRFAAKFESRVEPGAVQQLENRQTVTSIRLLASTLSGNSTLSLRSIEPMPARLSLDFARRAYARLAELGAGAAS